MYDAQLDEKLQARLSELLEANREGILEQAGRTELDRMMAIYRRGLVRKAQALNVAVARRLRPPLTYEIKFFRVWYSAPPYPSPRRELLVGQKAHHP